jgi:serine/threonine protein kinase
VPVLHPPYTHVSSYEIVREVAHGLYAAVYEARHTHPKLRDRRIALRVLRHNKYAPHFMSAARLNARLEHPHIPALHQVGEYEGRLYTARNFVEGDDLQNGIRGERRNIEEVLRIAGDVAGALEYAHGRGIVHGYVHPRHILLGPDGFGWLIGFGEYPLPELEVFGNPLHVAPEQFSNCNATPATDVYCLSETCFWVLSGRHPFHHVGIADLLKAKNSEDLQRGLRETNPDISSAIEKVLLRGLSPDPAARYGSPGGFVAALVEAHGTGKKSWWRVWG